MAHNKTYQRESSPKNPNRQESPERGLQRRESVDILKKIVSPIKEEVQYNSVENSLQDVSYDVPSGQGLYCVFVWLNVVGSVLFAIVKNDLFIEW